MFDGVLPWRNLIMLCAVCLMGPLAGCSSELDPTEPDDAYLIFREALFDKSAEQVWTRLDEDTRAYFEKSHGELEEMEQDIEKYLPQADHRLAKAQSGAILLRASKDGRSLFLNVMTLEGFEKDEAVELGSRVETLELTEDQATARITTRGGQVFYMTRGKDEQWYVMLYKSSEELKKSMAWLEVNKVALRQTIDDLIAEERARREVIIAELMKK